MGWVVNATPRSLYPQERSGRLLQEAGWAPGTVWRGAENLAPTGIRSPDCPARSELLYRLRYPGFYSGLFPRLLIAVLSSMMLKYKAPNEELYMASGGGRGGGGGGEENEGGGGRFIYLFTYYSC